MTARTYTNGEIVWPDGERTKVPSIRVEFSEREPQSGVRMQPFRAEVRFEPMRISQREYERILRAFPRVCWKCYDGRTRSHNRRCARRGGRSTEAP